MTERLTEAWYDDMEQFDRYAPKSPNIEINCGGDDFQRIIDKLAEYETAEEEGRLVVLPCKVGDTVYVIAPIYRLCETKHKCNVYDYENYLVSWCEQYCPYGYKGIGVIADTVESIDISQNGICFNMLYCGYVYSDKIFASREESEKALKEMEGK